MKLDSTGYATEQGTHFKMTALPVYYTSTVCVPQWSPE